MIFANDSHLELNKSLDKPKKITNPYRKGKYSIKKTPKLKPAVVSREKPLTKYELYNAILNMLPPSVWQEVKYQAGILERPHFPRDLGSTIDGIHSIHHGHFVFGTTGGRR